jgi:predicted GNAT family acetyltransferase
MGWSLTGDLEEYVARAGEFLRADPVENTVPLGVIESLRAAGADAFGPDPLFGWWTSSGRVRGACLRTGAFPMLLSDVPVPAAEALAAELADRRVPAVSGDPAVSRAFAAEWSRRTGTGVEVRMRQRLFRLDALRTPDPLPDGAWRVATAADHALVRTWFAAFEEEATGGGAVSSRLIDDRLSYGGVVLWETAGEPVALAARTRMTCGMTRIGPVYTPAAQRRRGYGAAVTAVLTREALEAGAEHVVLFTDLANPTSNAIYVRLGYRPASDRLVLAFTD